MNLKLEVSAEKRREKEEEKKKHVVFDGIPEQRTNKEKNKENQKTSSI